MHQCQLHAVKRKHAVCHVREYQVQNCVAGMQCFSNRILLSSRPRLTNIDRDSAQHMAVTVSDVTVIITDYKLLSPAQSPPVTPDTASPASSVENRPEPGPSSSADVNGNSTAVEEAS